MLVSSSQTSSSNCFAVLRSSGFILIVLLRNKTNSSLSLPDRLSIQSSRKAFGRPGSGSRIFPSSSKNFATKVRSPCSSDRRERVRIEHPFLQGDALFCRIHLPVTHHQKCVPHQESRVGWPQGSRYQLKAPMELQGSLLVLEVTRVG